MIWNNQSPRDILEVIFYLFFILLWRGKKGIGVLEAPVTGGMALLKQGKMTVLVGGDKQLFQDCAPILQQSSKMVLYMGEIGTTYTMIAKLISNMLAAVNVVTMGDALQLGKLVAWIWTN